MNVWLFLWNCCSISRLLSEGGFPAALPALVAHPSQEREVDHHDEEREGELLVVCPVDQIVKAG